MRPADHVSRRNFLQAGALGVTGLAAVRPRVAWAQNGEPKRGGSLVVRSGPLRGIDPHLETWAAALQVIHQTYNALLKFNHDGTKILPDLAESWEQKDDLTYSFKLRQGVRFHNVPPVNGRELTSEDVKYSIERQMTDQPGKSSTPTSSSTSSRASRPRTSTPSCSRPGSPTPRSSTTSRARGR